MDGRGLTLTVKVRGLVSSKKSTTFDTLFPPVTSTEATTYRLKNRNLTVQGQSPLQAV